MKKLILFNLVSADGFFEGPNHDISWHNVDEEFNRLAVEQLDSVDTLIFGRVTYELMAGYWPTPEAIKNDTLVANRMNALSKIVFSRTLKKAEWNNTRLIKDNIEQEILSLKKQTGKDLILFGSANLASSLLQWNLIDEVRIMVNPVILGKGTPLFKNINKRINLKLIKTKTFSSGNVVLYYVPINR